MTTTTTTDATPDDKAAATQLHQEGLRRALAILSTQEPTAAYYTLLRLQEAGQLDAQLADHAPGADQARCMHHGPPGDEPR